MQTEQSPDDLIIIEPYFVRAETGKRFANYIIDIIVFYLVIFAGSFLLALLAPTMLDNLTTNGGGFGLIDRIFDIGMYGVYMGIIETLFKGRSVGKFITGTRAVNLDGTKISGSTAFARGFSRAVPFCPLSALGSPCSPWQDSWTNTMVIDEKRQS